MPVGLRLQQFGSVGLDCINLQIEAGQCLCLSGASGSGKTRLLRAIAELDPHTGEASIDNQPCSQMSAPDWRSQVGFLPAEGHWWAEWVGDHISLDSLPLLTALDLPADCFDWEISRLSTGERQRLALVRLLQRKPRALLLDEPTANLDQENAQRVEHLLRGYQQQTPAALLWVSHDPQQQRRVADQALVIRNQQLEPVIWS